MKKALLVDDDYLVRSYLKMLPSWTEAGFEIVADVRDGEEALDILEKEDIDLVVTDIAMPLMDGIELIKAVKEKYSYTYIVVLSCHDEFEYVKDAMKMGADEYVLKNTLDEKELKDILAVAKRQINDKKDKVSDGYSGNEKIAEYDVNRAYLFFNKILAGTLLGEEREETRKKAGIRGLYKNSAAIVIKLDEKEISEDPLDEIKKEQECLEFVYYFKNKMDSTLEEYKDESTMVYLRNGIFCCFVDLSEIHKSSMMFQKLTSIANTCFDICKERYDTYRVGVSNVCIGPDSLREAYQQAKIMAKVCFYEKEKIRYYESGIYVGKVLPKEATDFVHEIDGYRYNNDKEGFLKGARQVISSFRRDLTERKLTYQWIQQVQHTSGISIVKKYTLIHSIEDVIDFVNKIADEIFDSIEIEIPENVSSPVKIAAEFARSHFRESIGLNDAANAAGVNSTYLSYLFSHETGIRFANYLLNMRIEFAKKLLEESNLKMREIAEKSGFNDYHYFSKVFKKMNGLSPIEYKKKNSRMI